MGLRAAIIIFVLASVILSVFARCPPVNQVRGKECRQDYDCRKGVCCPNSQGKKSCVTTVAYQPDQSKNYGTQQKTGTGSYCNGVKCMPYQVCKPDRYSGKLTCQ